MNDRSFEPLTPKALFGQSGLRPTPPSQYQFSPCGRYVTYLQGSADAPTTLDLWCFDRTQARHSLLVSAAELDVQADEAVTQLSDAERAERERRRQFTFGIGQYRWLGSNRALILYADGQAYTTQLNETGEAAKPTGLTPKNLRHSGFQPSPSGKRMSYVREGDLYYLQLTDPSQEVRVTADADACVTSGLPDFLAAEEMHRFQGAWWSSCERYLIYCRNDESAVAVSYRLEIDGNGSRTVEQRYPFAGEPNPQVTLCLYDTESETSQDIWRSEQSPNDAYLARLNCFNGGLLIQTQDRLQQTLTLQRYEFATGRWQLIYQEVAKTWINLSDDLQVIDDQRLVFSTEDNGQRQALVLSTTAEPVRLQGPAHINQILCADEEHMLATGWDDTPIENHLYELALDGSGFRRLTQDAGVHDVIVNHQQGLFLDRFSDEQTPLTISVRDFTDTKPEWLYRETIDAQHPYFPYSQHHATAKFGTLEAAGQTLHYRLTAPAQIQGTHPTIVYVYGGPGVQKVRKDWGSLLVQMLAQQGYGVLEVDNRGSANRGRDFEAAIYQRMGSVEVADQLAGLQVLEQISWADPERIGIFGHSYGGYMSLMCLCQAGHRFKAGVAVAPVADWRLYDTHYTERFMGLPQDNAADYENSSVLPHLAKLERPLMLMHGMADDNVLFTHSTMLMSELQKLGKPFELMTYPGAKHSMQEIHVSIHRFDAILSFFGRVL